MCMGLSFLLCFFGVFFCSGVVLCNFRRPKSYVYGVAFFVVFFGIFFFRCRTM